MRLLMLPRYGALGASSRVRMYQYLPALESAGVAVAVSPLFGNGYVRALYESRHSLVEVALGYVRRIRAQLSAARYDVVWVEKELLPWLPTFAERVRGNPRVVVDYDDAVFHRYDQHRSALVRRLQGQRIDAVMRHADLVTAGNDYLAERARGAGCPRVEWLPTVVDLERYAPSLGRDAGAPVVIGWIGSPATAHYLQPLASVIAGLEGAHAVRAVAVGARPDQVAGTPFEAVAWSEAEEVSLVASFDIGIMPLQDSPWERGKCGYKLIQYMACGLPVVASPVGVNTRIVQHGENGFLAGSQDEWRLAIGRLVADADMRNCMGRIGRRQVEEAYSLQAQAPRLVAMLESLQ
jgi:glycosyltransferase involved in cell wall biosynthesis